MPIRQITQRGRSHLSPQTDRDRPEWVIGINRNDWSGSIGTGDRNQSVRAGSDSALSSRTISLQIMYVVAPQGPNVALALKPVYLCAGFYPIEADNLLHAAFLFAVWKARRRFGPGGIFSRLMVTQTDSRRRLVRGYPHEGCYTRAIPVHRAH